METGCAKIPVDQQHAAAGLPGKRLRQVGRHKRFSLFRHTASDHHAPQWVSCRDLEKSRPQSTKALRSGRRCLRAKYAELRISSPPWSRAFLDELLVDMHFVAEPRNGG